MKPPVRVIVGPCAGMDHVVAVKALPAAVRTAAISVVTVPVRVPNPRADVLLTAVAVVATVPVRVPRPPTAAGRTVVRPAVTLCAMAVSPPLIAVPTVGICVVTGSALRASPTSPARQIALRRPC